MIRFAIYQSNSDERKTYLAYNHLGQIGIVFNTKKA